MRRPPVRRLPRRGVGCARARRRVSLPFFFFANNTSIRLLCKSSPHISCQLKRQVAVRDAHVVRRASRGGLDLDPEEETRLQVRKQSNTIHTLLLKMKPSV